MKQKLLRYITYQTFPAETANSLQTISNIKYFVKNNFQVELYFPLREKSSSSNLDEIKNFYSVEEDFVVFGLSHKFPFGKIKLFKQLWFHLSHFFWSRKNVKKIIKKNKNSLYFTRSDWVLFFLAKNNKNVIFECHQVTKVRKFVLNRVKNYQNVKVIFLNEKLSEYFKELHLNSVILHSGVDVDIFSSFKNVSKKENKIIYVGNLLRFGKKRGLDFIIKAFSESDKLNDYNLEIVGGPREEVDRLKKIILKKKIKNVVISGRLNRKDTINKILESNIGILINSGQDLHSREFTSPLKYFEYIYGNLNVLAVDFPSHRVLPYSENITYFKEGDIEDFISSILEPKKIKKIKNFENLSLDKRVKEIIKFSKKD